MGDERRRRRAAWRFLGGAVRAQGRGVVAGVGAGIVWQAAAVTAPLLVQRAIDDGIRAEDARALVVWTLALVGVGLVEVVTWGVRHWFAIRNGTRADAGVRDGIFAHALALDARYHDRVGAGELMSRASSDSEYVRRVVDNLNHTAGYAVTVVAVAIVLLVLDLRLAALVLLPLPFVSAAMWRYSQRYAEPSERLQAALARTATLAEESIAGVRVVKGLGAGDAVAARFRRASDAAVERGLAVARVDAAFLPALEALPLLALVAVLWYGGTRALEGAITVGELVAFYAYVVLLVWPLRTLGQRISTLQRGLAAAARITEVLEQRPAVAEPEDARPLRSPRGDVRFEDVRFGYDPAEPVLDGFSLSVPAGTSVALVGATGSGKSTVAGLLARFYDADAGSVLLDGEDVRRLRLADVRRAVGIVFEEAFLFSDTVRANVAFARPEATDAEIEEALRLAGALEIVAALPDGLDTVLGERGFSLSGGQRQRLAIARALVGDPAVLVLDDATSAVDAATEREIRDALATAMRGRTTIVIAHRPMTIALADRVALVDRGRVAEQGTHAELLASSPRYRGLLALEEAAA